MTKHNYTEGSTVNVFLPRFETVGTVDSVTASTVTVEFIGPSGPDTRTFRVRDGQTTFHNGPAIITPR